MPFEKVRERYSRGQLQALSKTMYEYLQRGIDRSV